MEEDAGAVHGISAHTLSSEIAASGFALGQTR
jgi:hypothetical protein